MAEVVLGLYGIFLSMTVVGAAAWIAESRAEKRAESKKACAEIIYRTFGENAQKPMPRLKRA
jgi:hypothetical protein